MSAAQHLRVVRGSVRDVSFTSTAFPVPHAQVEDAVLDAYDRAYERALRSASESRRQELEVSSVAQWCLTLCNPMDCSTPGFPVLHHLLELAQTHVH